MDIYPASPNNVPEALTAAKASYKKQALLAMAGLIGFMLFYLAVAITFGLITYNGVMKLSVGESDIIAIIITVCSFLLTLFMVKSLFAVRKAGEPGGIEVSQENEPTLFEFLHTLSDEIGAPRPHRVFITPEVNAAVFYDLSLINLIFPSKKNLIIGLGLVNVLNLGELKAVLAHEFGHFAQGSMMVGRWVYIAQQIIAHMVATRDWLDKIVNFISRIDLRIAWIGWVLSIILWSIRSIMDTLFDVVIIAERALSREMEFNADLVAVSVTGSDALINALYKLQAADHAWQTALDVAEREAGSGKLIEDLFQAQEATVKEMRRVLDDADYGQPSLDSEGNLSENHRVFTEETARPPQMWSTHPASSDRENNAKSTYIVAAIDNRQAWDLFASPVTIRKQISLNFYHEDKIRELKTGSPQDAVYQRFNKAAYSPEYRGVYLNRSPVRDFSSVNKMLSMATNTGDISKAIAALYPESLTDNLEVARNLEIEKDTLEALAAGDLKPSGGVIRHRGEEISKAEIPQAIQGISDELHSVSKELMLHDANCRNAHLQAAKQAGQGWYESLLGLLQLLHCTEHMAAAVNNENVLLTNTWQVITADGQIGHFEKKRMIAVCKKTHAAMSVLSEKTFSLKLPKSILESLGIEDWDKQCPEFDFIDVNKKNWIEWAQAASEAMSNMAHLLSSTQALALEELINTETKLRAHILEQATLDPAPPTAICPSDYPTLLPGQGHTLQHKLDLWNRFQLAHGIGPTLLRLGVSLGVVGGTMYGGFFGL